MLSNILFISVHCPQDDDWHLVENICFITWSKNSNDISEISTLHFSHCTLLYWVTWECWHHVRGEILREQSTWDSGCVREWGDWPECSVVCRPWCCTQPSPDGDTLAACLGWTFLVNTPPRHEWSVWRSLPHLTLDRRPTRQNTYQVW